jgi:hypothetical protein
LMYRNIHYVFLPFKKFFVSPLITVWMITYNEWKGKLVLFSCLMSVTSHVRKTAFYSTMYVYPFITISLCASWKSLSEWWTSGILSLVGNVLLLPSLLSMQLDFCFTDVLIASNSQSQWAVFRPVMWQWQIICRLLLLWNCCFYLPIIHLYSRVPTSAHATLCVRTGMAESVQQLAMGRTIWWSGFDSWRGLGIFLFDTMSRSTLALTQPPVQWVMWVVSRGVKQPGSEADHSTTSSAEVKECTWSYTSTPSICLHGVVIS